MAEAPRPGAAGENDRIAGDPPLLGDDDRYTPGLGFESTGRAAGHDLRPPVPRAERNGGCCQEGLGAAVVFRIESAHPFARGAGLQPISLLTADQTAR